MSKAERDTVAELLQQSAPRPVPVMEDLATARAVLRNEWREISGRRRTRRRLRNLALAATVLLGALVAVQLQQAPPAPAVTVATINKTFGTVYLLGEDSELRPTKSLATVLSGQTIVTARNAGLAISWGQGGSMRVDEDTRIRFADDTTVFLEDGRVYFDSAAGLPAGIDGGDEPTLVLETGQGVVTHLGTQYMVEVDRDRLVVSVREGEVLVAGRYHEQRVDTGQQATLTGMQRPSVLGIGRSGGGWTWIERTTPVADVDGRTLFEFLAWASRELGLELSYEGAAEEVARAAVLRGRIDTTPTDALRLRLATAALHWRIDEGVIYISD